MAKHVVAAAKDIPPGSRKLVTVDGRPVIVFNIKGEYFGILNRCPHQGGDLSRGTLVGMVTAPEPGVYCHTRKGELLRCPWHGWHFDVRTGQSWSEPERVRTRTYPVDLAEGAKLVEGPYKAETIPVTVEESYLVIEA